VLLDFEQAAMGAEILAVEAGFIAIEEVEGARFVGESAESHGREKRGAEHGSAVFVMLAEELGIDGIVLNIPDALLTEAGYSHDVDQGFLEGRGRLKFVAEVCDDLEKGLGVFGFQEDLTGEQAVFFGVAGSGKFAGGRDRSAGSGSVGTGSLDLKGSAHFGDFVIARVLGTAGVKGEVFGDCRGDIDIFPVNWDSRLVAEWLRATTTRNGWAVLVKVHPGSHAQITVAPFWGHRRILRSATRHFRRIAGRFAKGQRRIE
jgi:hypothetical protein